MIPSQNCWNLAKHSEGCRLKAFIPVPGDPPTIGWGATGKDIHLGLVWTQNQCDTRFIGDINTMGASVTHLIAGHPTTQNQFDALVSFAYNEGAEALRTSTLLAEHNAGQFGAAAGQFMRWIYKLHPIKVVLPGLLVRRGAEQALYMKP